MYLLVSVTIGVVVGWIASALMPKSQTRLLDSILGGMGGLVGGLTTQAFSQTQLDTYYSLLIPMIGAIFLTWIGRMMQKSAYW